MSKTAAQIPAIRFKNSGIIIIKWSVAHHDTYAPSRGSYVRTCCTLKTTEQCNSPGTLEESEIKIIKEID
jgi:hypothetical protein